MRAVSTRYDPPEEADLIRRSREAAVPPMSRRQAAAKAGISPSQWSDVERGHKMAGPGVIVPVRATPETLARMAQAVGVNDVELVAAGREDAAQQFRTASRQRVLHDRLSAVPGLGVLGRDLRRDVASEELLPIVAAGLDAIEQSELPATVKRDLASMFVENLAHDAGRRYGELTLILRLAGDSSPTS